MSQATLRKKNRILLFVAALSVGVAAFLPLWKITLDAPQYPEGLGMVIWPHSISGESTHDLKNINLLNHYVGMKVIDPDSIPELNWMPWIFLYLFLVLLLPPLLRRKGWILFALANLTLIAVVGLVDFYLWEYDYGHNLSADAPIKIPGMVYDPPLVACKTMLNITACSYPHVGGVLVLAAGVILVYVYLDERKSRTA